MLLRSSHIRSSNGGSGILRIGYQASASKLEEPPTRVHGCPGAIPRSADTTSASRCGRKQRVTHLQSIHDEIVAMVIGDIEHGEDRRIDDCQAHDASRTSRTAATTSSTVTPVPRGAGYVAS